MNRQRRRIKVKKVCVGARLKAFNTKMLLKTTLGISSMFLEYCSTTISDKSDQNTLKKLEQYCEP